MKKFLIIPILLSSFSFSADIELYTSAVIKLVKENKKMNKEIIDNKREILVLKKMIKYAKVKKINIDSKSDKEIFNINKIDSFIAMNN